MKTMLLAAATIFLVSAPSFAGSLFDEYNARGERDAADEVEMQRNRVVSQAREMVEREANSPVVAGPELVVEEGHVDRYFYKTANGKICNVKVDAGRKDPRSWFLYGEPNCR